MTDFTKDSRQNVLDLLNAANTSNYTKAHLAFGNPIPNSEVGPLGEVRNTKIDLIGTPQTAFVGAVTVYYDRVALNDVINTVDYVFDNSALEANTVHDLLPWFADQGLLLLPEDVENDLLLMIADENEQVIRAKTGSIGFLGTGKIKITK